MDSSMFDGAAKGCACIIIILVIVAFCLGFGVSSCARNYGHPTVGWSQH